MEVLEAINEFVLNVITPHPFHPPTNPHSSSSSHLIWACNDLLWLFLEAINEFALNVNVTKYPHPTPSRRHITWSLLESAEL